MYIQNGYIPRLWRKCWPLPNTNVYIQHRIWLAVMWELLCRHGSFYFWHFIDKTELPSLHPHRELVFFLMGAITYLFNQSLCWHATKVIQIVAYPYTLQCWFELPYTASCAAILFRKAEAVVTVMEHTRLCINFAVLSSLAQIRIKLLCKWRVPACSLFRGGRNSDQWGRKVVCARTLSTWLA